MAKTSTERSRLHRQRKSQQVPFIRQPPKTGAQRVREHRARQKALKATSAVVHNPTPQIGDMTQGKEEIKREADYCQLCVRTKENCVPLRGVTKKMLKIVAPRWNVEAYAEALVCEKCVETFTNLFRQKVLRLRTNESIMRHVKRSKRNNIDLKSVTGSHDLKNCQVCRYCLKMQFETQPYSYCENMMHKLHIAIPEVDTRVSSNPIICQECCVLVNSLVTFRNRLKFPESAVNMADTCQVKDVIEHPGPDHKLTTYIHQIKQDPVDIDDQIKPDPDDEQSEEQKFEFVDVMPKCEPELESAIYACVICSFSTNVLDLYETHIVTGHAPKKPKRVSNEPPFKCAECGFTSIHRSSMHVHKQIHNASSAETVCKICNAKFRSSRSLAQHLGRLHKIKSKSKIAI